MTNNPEYPESAMAMPGSTIPPATAQLPIDKAREYSNRPKDTVVIDSAATDFPPPNPEQLAPETTSEPTTPTEPLTSMETLLASAVDSEAIPLSFQPSGQWVPANENFLKEKRLGVVITYLSEALITGIPLFFLTWWAGVLAAAFFLTIGAIRFVQMRRLVASYGYQERETDLLITHGVLFRHLIVVPYGRMQVLKVESGPIQRKYGLATLTLVTASAESNAAIHGITQEQADDLRDRLAKHSDPMSAGL